MNSISQQPKKRTKQDFLLTFFRKPNKAEQIKVNGFVLNRYFSNNTKKWEVMIFTEDSWFKYERYIKPTPLITPSRKTKFKRLFDELQTAVQHNSK